MTTTHKTTVHMICAHGKRWDYYDVEYTPTDFVLVEDFEDICDRIRGGEMFQEQFAESLSAKLPAGELVVTGRHGSNAITVCKL